jgi:hypothetical protein
MQSTGQASRCSTKVYGDDQISATSSGTEKGSKFVSFSICYEVIDCAELMPKLSHMKSSLTKIKIFLHLAKAPGKRTYKLLRMRD